MTNTLLIGPAASGKTEACLEVLLREREGASRRPVWVLLPDRAQAVAFRRRLARRGGALGVRVETFPAMVEDLLVRVDAARPRASEPLRRRLMGASLAELAANGQLPHYEPISSSPGMIGAMVERIEELKRAGHTSESFRRYTQDKDPRLQEIAAIYGAYEARLEAIGWADREGLALRAIQALQTQSERFSDLELIVVDGFDSFSPTQLDLLAGLAEAGLDLFITLPGSGEGEGRRAFRRFGQTVDDLKNALPALVIRLAGDAIGLPRQLGQLERSLFEGTGDSSLAGDHLQFLRARTPADEVREALRWLKARILRDGEGAETCALILTDPEGYADIVRQVAAEFGLPVRLRAGERLDRAPSVVALLDLLDISRQDWPRRLTLEAIRAPFFDLSPHNLSRRDAASLEAVSYWGQIVEGRDQWMDSLERLVDRSDLGGERDEEGGVLQLPDESHARRLLAGLDSFFHRISPPASQTASVWVRWLEDLLDDYRYFEEVRSDQEKVAGLRLREVFRSIVMAEAAAGLSERSYEAFLEELRGAIEGARFRPQQDWRQARTQVVSVEEARGLRFRAVAVVGLSEGQLPQIEREDTFLPDPVRSELGLEPRLGRAQEGLFYQAVTRSDWKLLLTRPTLAGDGEAWEPSPYWSAALAAAGVGPDEVPILRPADPRPLEAAASEQELSFLAVRRGGLPGRFEALGDRLAPLRRIRELIISRQAAAPSGRHEGDLGTRAESFAASYGADHIWSPSRLETYGACPHQFFAAQVLGLEALEPPELGPDARQLGTLLHRILEEAYRNASNPSDPEAVLRALEDLAQSAFDDAPRELGFRPSPLWEVERAQWKAALEQTIRAVAEVEDGWHPFGYERKFGLEGEAALQLETSEGPVRVRGVIDRLDRRESDELRVIDYKTGSSHLGKADLMEGRRLQLPLYALAAERALDAGRVVDGFYWVLRGAKPGGLRLARFTGQEDGSHKGGPQAAYNILRQHLERIVRGVREGQFPPIPPRGGCPGYCPAADYCWRYSPGYRRG